jgi:hypothetical protein
MKLFDVTGTDKCSSAANLTATTDSEAPEMIREIDLQGL